MAALVWAGAACRDRPPAPELELVGYTPGLLQVLDACAGLARASLPRSCERLAEAIRPCEVVRARCSAGDETCSLGERAACVDATAAGALGLASGEWLVRGPVAGGGRFAVRGRPAAETVRIDGELHASPGTSWLRFVPGSPSAGAGVLSGDGSLLHVRVRPRGGLVPARSEDASVAERLYALRTELFSQAILEGTGELAIFPPGESAELPDVAIAVDFRLRSAAEAAIESYIRELQEQWPVVRSDYAFAGLEGACLDDLRVLPELAPCYVITDTALVVGWNRRSLERSLAPGGARFDRSNVAVVDFDRLAEADRRLAATRAGAVPGLRYAFRRGKVIARELPDGFSFELTLEGRRE